MMRKLFQIPAGNAMPSMAAVLQGQGISPSEIPNEKIKGLAKEALQILIKTTCPSGVMMELRPDDFSVIYRGEGNNDPEAPLGKIINSCSSLAIFAVTLGDKVSNEISKLFAQNDLALASMLDSAASESAEMAAEELESHYRSLLDKSGQLISSSGIMRFSPGYCGWDISGQKKLFEALRPDEIGIELTGSFLMRPLKSISGVIVAGAREIFEFDDNFAFCAECSSHSCRERIKALFDN